MEQAPRKPNYKETTNLAFAAYAHLSGLAIVKATDSRRGGVVEYEFTFDDGNQTWDDLQFAFANSESARFDNAVRTLKQLCRRSCK